MLRHKLRLFFLLATLLVMLPGCRLREDRACARRAAQCMKDEDLILSTCPTQSTCRGAIASSIAACDADLRRLCGRTR